jgi:2-phosphoglycerate kinase
MDEVTIKKRGGEIEYFSYDKLVVAIGKTGIPLKDAETIAEKIKKWLIKKKKSVITSNQIRDKIIELLKNKFPAEADSFQAYKK